MDGASRLTILWRIVLPLSAPALATLAALTFLDSWNNFLWPLIAINSTSQMTLPLGLATFQGAHATEWTLLMAGNVMSLVPMLVIFFAAQRYFVRSVASDRAGRHMTARPPVACGPATCIRKEPGELRCAG